MRYAIVGEHKRRFREEGWIAFEEIVSRERAAEALSAVRHADARRDLWRKSEAVRRVVVQRRLAEVAGELFDARALRLAFDQIVEPSEKGSLAKFSGIQGIVGGCVIRLSADAEEPALLQQQGSGLFISREYAMELVTEGVYLLVAYCKPISVYIANPEDRYNHFLKSLGLGFGDCLSNETHPMLLS